MATRPRERSRSSGTTTSRSWSMTWERPVVRQRSPEGASWPSPRSRSSRFFRTPGEWMRDRPLPCLLVHSLDVVLELLAVDPPDSPAAELDRGKLATAYQRVDLRDPNVEDRRDVFERIETRLDAGRWHAASWSVSASDSGGWRRRGRERVLRACPQ